MEDVNSCMAEMKRRGLLSIADYAREDLSAEEEKEMGKIIEVYKGSIDNAINVDKANCIAMKVSSFANMDYMKRMNELQVLLRGIEEGLLDNLSTEEILAKVCLVLNLS